MNISIIENEIDVICSPLTRVPKRSTFVNLEDLFDRKTKLNNLYAQLLRCVNEEDMDTHIKFIMPLVIDKIRKGLSLITRLLIEWKMVYQFECEKGIEDSSEPIEMSHRPPVYNSISEVKTGDRIYSCVEEGNMRVEYSSRSNMFKANDLENELLVVDESENCVTLSNLNRCVVIIPGTIKSLTAQGLKECQIYVNIIKGSFLMYKANNTVIDIGNCSSQVRIHESSDLIFGISGLKAPIIEKCINIAFYPSFIEAFKPLEESYDTRNSIIGLTWSNKWNNASMVKPLDVVDFSSQYMQNQSNNGMMACRSLKSNNEWRTATICYLKGRWLNLNDWPNDIEKEMLRDIKEIESNKVHKEPLDLILDDEEFEELDEL